MDCAKEEESTTSVESAQSFSQQDSATTTTEESTTNGDESEEMVELCDLEDEIIDNQDEDDFFGANEEFSPRTSSTPSATSCTATAASEGFFDEISSFQLPDNYQILENKGNGTYGVVVSALDKSTGQTVAIKRIIKAFDRDYKTQHRILREIKLFKYFDHPNVVKIVDLIKPEKYNQFNDVCIVMELMPTNLHNIIYSKQYLSDLHIKFILFQILSGLNYIHSSKVLHRDIKPGNILIDENSHIKICDFGFSRALCEEDGNIMSTNYVATRHYRAPELALGCKKGSPALDLWSVGCILGELYLKSPLFPGTHAQNQLEKIIAITGVPMIEENEEIEKKKKRNPKKQFYEIFDEWGIPQSGKEFLKSNFANARGIPLKEYIPDAPDDAIDLLENMLKLNPSERISAKNALNHKFFDEIREKTEEIETEESDKIPKRFDATFENDLTPGLIPFTDFKELIHQEIMTFEKRKPDTPNEG